MGAMRWIEAGSVEAYEREPMRVVDTGARDVLVCRAGESFLAVEDRCSHDDGPLGQGTLRGCEVECPRHGARFDLASGAALCLPAIAPIATFPVKVEDGVVYVGVDD